MTNDSGKGSPHVERFTDWQPPGVQMCLAASSRNFVGLMEDGLTVLKYPQRMSENSMDALREEADRYRCLGIHENLAAFKAVHANGLLFEYCERGDLHAVINGPTPLSDEEKIAIGEQIVHGLAHLHALNYIHCDINVNNVFVTSGMIAKIGDIQGQLYWPDGTIRMPTMSEENPKSRHPDAGENEFSHRTDIFALGTLLYHLWHGQPPFPDLDEYSQKELIQAKFRKEEYPVDVQQATGICKIMLKCWTSAYKDVNEILADMARIHERDDSAE